MSPVEWASRVAKDFEYDLKDVRKATKHFMKQMG
jgi:hypothetical protein